MIIRNYIKRRKEKKLATITTIGQSVYYLSYPEYYFTVECIEFEHTRLGGVELTIRLFGRKVV